MAKGTGPTLRSLAKDVAGLRRELDQAKKTLARQQYLEDRLAIHDVLNKYTHAVDRHDRKAFLAVFHPDAIADHGMFAGTAAAVFEFLEPRYHANNQTHAHIICNHLCDIDGDTAHTETYAITYGVAKDGSRIMLGSARYIDRFEKRKGQWKIALRRIVTDARGQVPVMGEAAREGKWDKTDISYMRPLTLPAARRKIAVIK